MKMSTSNIETDLTHVSSCSIRASVVLALLHLGKVG